MWVSGYLWVWAETGMCACVKYQRYFARSRLKVITNKYGQEVRGGIARLC